MKEYGLFSFILNLDKLPIILEKFPDLKISNDVKIDKHRIFILKNSILYDQMKNYLDGSKIDYIYNERVEFDRKEYQNAQLLNCVGVSINDWGYEFDTQYKIISGCEKRECPKIEVQTSPLHLDIKKFGNHEFKMLLSREFVVSNRFRNLIEVNGLTGCSFAPVMHKKTEKIAEDIFQLNVNNILPEVSNDFKREVIKCEKCGAEVLIQRCWQFVYNKEVLNDAKDFNLTNEYFSVTYPFRELIISQRVYQLIKEHKIKGSVCVPVKLV